MKNLSVQLKAYEQILGWIYFVFQLLGLGAIAIALNMLLGNPLSLTQLNVLLFVLNFLAIIAIFHRFLWENLQKFLSRFGKNMALTALGLGIYVTLANTISMVIMVLDPSYANANDSNIAGMLDESYWAMAIATVLLVPITEEVLYRGLLFGSLYKRNRILGLILSMVLFALIHVAPYIGTFNPLHLLLSFFAYLPAGFAFAWVYVSTDSIFSCTLIHMLVNLIGILIVR